MLASSRKYKSYMKVDESFEVRVCVTVFLTLLSRSNENKS